MHQVHTLLRGRKFCELCDQPRPVHHFKPHRGSKDGLRNRCIPCSTPLSKAKTCDECGAWRLLRDFPINAQRTDGRGSWCTPCSTKAALEVRARMVQIRRERAAVVPLGDTAA